MSLPNFPVIDLSVWPDEDAAPSPALVQEIRGALQDVGFMVLVGHGVPQAVIDGAFAACAAFHAMPLDQKLSVRIDGNNNGYMPVKSTTIRTSTIADNAVADLNEAFFYRPELGPDHPDVLAGRKYRGLNQWPEMPHGFKERGLQYASAMERLASRLRGPLALALDLPSNWFETFFQAPQWVVRFSHYLPNHAKEDVHGLAPHTDASFFTLLPQTEIPGLEVRVGDSEWIAPPYIPGSFVFNSGDMLHRWSNGRLPSTPHRARPPVGQDRYAIPFFYGPDWDAEIAAAPSCVELGAAPSWPAITYANYMAWWYETNYGSVHVSGGGNSK